MIHRIPSRSLALLLALAVGAFASAADDPGGEGADEADDLGGEYADEMAERVTQVRERLMLTDEQVEKIGPILRKGLEAQAKLLAEQGFARDGAGSREGGRPNLRQMRKFRKEMDVIRESTRRELGEVLDEKQLAEYTEIQKERGAELRKRMRARR